MKKPDTAQRAAAKSTGISDAGFAKAYPRITEYLVTAKWDDGTARTPSALSMSCEDGAVQLALNDKALKQSLYCTAGSLAEALVLLEGALADGTGNWRQWKSGKGK